MSVTAKQALVVAKKYTDGSIEGITGSLAGKNCTIESQTYENGRNTIVFKWTADNGDVRRTTIVVRDGTPIYEWTSGDDYQYSDLVIYSSAFYRCITPNHDVEFDATKWNEIGSPDGNYDIVETSELLPPIFTSADRKVYFVIDEGLFYLWNGEAWSAQRTKWNDITGKPEFATVATSGSYNDLDNTPDIPSKTSDLNNDSNFVSDANYVHTDNNYDATAKGIVDGVTTALADKVDKVSGKGLSTNDYTDADKTIVSGVSTALDGKVDKVTGKGLSTEDYTTAEQTKLSGIEAGAQVNVQSNWSQTNSEADDYIKNKPEIPDAQIQSDWNQSDNTLKDFIKNKPEIPAAQIQSDWNQSNNEAKDFIKNKPTLGTASSKNVAESGDASATEVVMGNDTRLTDSRNAKDVYEWAKAVSKPTYTASEVGAVSSTQYATDMPKKVDKLTIMPTASSEYAGKIYQFDGTTDQNYTHGYFYECKEEDNVYSWVNVPVSAGGDVSGKADKVSGATSGNFAGLDSNGNLTDSGSKASDFAASSQAVPSGGTTGQVLAKASGTDYDTEWVNASGGSGGHTIQDNAGISMTQRDNLQFKGLVVEDDSTNDTTIVSFINGATITPIGDVSIWLKCAGLHQTYTTLSDVLADSVILEILMDNTNAVDYLARSNTWSSDICANETAMTYIGTNNYCANILLADSTWRTAIYNSAYFESVLNTKVPNMTSDTTPIGEGTVVYNSQYSGNEAYKAFSNGEYLPAVNETTSQFYLGFCFDVETLIEKVYIKARTYTASHYYDLALYGGNSLSGLTKLSSDLRIQNNTGGQEYSTILNNNTKYKYYVWKVTGSNMSYTHQSGVDYLAVTRTQFYGRNNKEILPAPLTPDYVDAQYNNSTTYSKGDTCISGNVRYRYINSTSSSGHQPPNDTYWEVLSVSDEINAKAGKIVRIVVVPKSTTSYMTVNLANLGLKVSDFDMLYCVRPSGTGNYLRVSGSPYTTPIEIFKKSTDTSYPWDIGGSGVLYVSDTSIKAQNNDSNTEAHIYGIKF